jgi:glycerol uptake facilitator-like aquaporin
VALSRRVVAETLGTALLLAVVVGSGIMAERLSQGNTGLALLANALATGAGLFALISSFSPLSGAHFNPAVTLVECLRGLLSARDAAFYVVAQVLGALLGVVLAHLMFGLPLVSWSQTARSGASLGASEMIATFGLLAVILSVSRKNAASVPQAVAAYLVAAYWFTSSTSFANPAVTLARAFSDTFAGIRLLDVPLFVGAQLLGALLALGVLGWLWREPSPQPNKP